MWPANGPKLKACILPFQLHRKLMTIQLKQGWGMTEVTCSLLGWGVTDTSIPSSVGELNANCYAKIMDPDGKTEVPLGERGEIWVQGPKWVHSKFPFIFPAKFFQYLRPYSSIFPLRYLYFRENFNIPVTILIFPSIFPSMFPPMCPFSSHRQYNSK